MLNPAKIFSQNSDLPDVFNVVQLEADNRIIAEHYAPIIHQMAERGHTKSANGRADLITGVFFDGNMDATDNWKNLANFENENPINHHQLDPIVYYSVIWTIRLC